LFLFAFRVLLSLFFCCFLWLLVLGFHLCLPVFSGLVYGLPSFGCFSDDHRGLLSYSNRIGLLWRFSDFFYFASFSVLDFLYFCSLTTLLLLFTPSLYFLS